MRGARRRSRWAHDRTGRTVPIPAIARLARSLLLDSTSQRRATKNMSHSGNNDISRRQALQAAAAIVPLHFGGRFATALAQLARTEPKASRVDPLALGARDAVEHIHNGDISA